MLGPEKADSVVLDEVSIVAPIKMLGSDLHGASSSTTLNRDELEGRHIYSMKELTALAPNYYQPDYGSRMTSSIRGFFTSVTRSLVTC